MTEALITYKAIGRVENIFDEPAAARRLRPAQP